MSIFKRLTLTLILFCISISIQAFDKEDFVNDISHAKNLFLEGKHDEAISYWEGKKSTYSGDLGHYEYELGIFYSRMKAFDKAEQIFLEGIKLDSKYPRLNIGLSNIYLWTGRFDQAAEWLDKLIADHPELPLGYYTKAKQEFQKKNYKLAKSLAELSLTKEKKAEGYYILALASFELYEARNVISAIENAINLNPAYLANLAAVKVYAVSLANQGLYDEAVIAIEELQSNNPQAAEDEEIIKLMKELKGEPTQS